MFERVAPDDDIRCNVSDMTNGLVYKVERLLPDLVDRGGEGIADGHGEHPGCHYVEDDSTLRRIGDGPIERTFAFGRAVDPHHNAMLRI